MCVCLIHTHIILIGFGSNDLVKKIFHLSIFFLLLSLSLFSLSIHLFLSLSSQPLYLFISVSFLAASPSLCFSLSHTTASWFALFLSLLPVILFSSSLLTTSQSSLSFSHSPHHHLCLTSLYICSIIILSLSFFWFRTACC